MISLLPKSVSALPAMSYDSTRMIVITDMIQKQAHEGKGEDVCLGLPSYADSDRDGE